MNIQETINILLILSMAYQDKSDPKQTAALWHTFLADEAYSVVERAVREYIKNDRRDYSGMPTVSAILGKVEEVNKRYALIVNSAIRDIEYHNLSKELQELIDEPKYDRLLTNPKDKIQTNRNTIIGYLKHNQEHELPYLAQNGGVDERKLLK